MRKCWLPEFSHFPSFFSIIFSFRVVNSRFFLRKGQTIHHKYWSILSNTRFNHKIELTVQADKSRFFFLIRCIKPPFHRVWLICIDCVTYYEIIPWSLILDHKTKSLQKTDTTLLKWLAKCLLQYWHIFGKGEIGTYQHFPFFTPMFSKVYFLGR